MLRAQRLRYGLSFFAILRSEEIAVEFARFVRLLLVPVAPGAVARPHEMGIPMGAEPVRLEARHRSARMLRTAMGGAIGSGSSAKGPCSSLRCEFPMRRIEPVRSFCDTEIFMPSIRVPDCPSTCDTMILYPSMWTRQWTLETKNR